MDIAFDFLRGNPILQQIRDAPKLDKGSKLSVSSKGSTATVLPRTIATQPNNRMKSQVSAPVPEVVPTAEQAMTPTSGIEDFLNQLAGQSEEPMASAMPALEGFEDVSSDFDIKDPLQFASLGQSYLTDAIRAARRRAQSRRDYMRTMMMMAMMPNMSPLGIGGGLNVG
jgi:hypothetical protein